MLVYQKRTSEIYSEFHTSENGLTQHEASERLKSYGLNTIRVKGEPLWRKLIEPFWNVFMAVLILAAGVSVFQGEVLDAVIVIVIILISAGIYYVQRFSTERILRALSKHDVQEIEVSRSNNILSVSSDELVPGDVIHLHEGQKVPADARVIHESNLRCDEALLTGESTPVSKQPHPLTGTKEVYDQDNILFQGSFIISGEVTAVVVATANNTEFGKLATLAGHKETKSPVQIKIDKLISIIVIVIAAISVLAFALSIYRGMEVAEALKFTLTLAVSAVPEGLPVAISVILVLGMRRMAKHKALVRNMKAIESIGVVTTIATDKTGTLTKNKLTLQHTWKLENTTSLHYSQAVYLAINKSNDKMHDPLDNAMHQYAIDKKCNTPTGYSHYSSMPFEHTYSMSGNVWKTPKLYHISVKGSPEQILSISRLTNTQIKQAEHELRSFTAKGYRVIALATTQMKKGVSSLSELPIKNFDFVGFMAVADVLRPEAKSAVAAAHSAGVNVAMVTGDHFETAYTIGKDIGIAKNRDEVFDSKNMSRIGERKLASLVDSTRVFSRVIPENKYRLLSALKKNHIVAMTGDGVNDVPALTNAHVGVAMGSGSQIAKEAGDIVLLDDNFKSIISAIREGRTIFSNIQRMLYYLLATSSGEVITMIGALVLGLPLPLYAVQILWINLVTDTAMVIPLGLEPAEKNIMKRKPRSPNAPILSRFIIYRMVMIALTMAITALSIFFVMLQFNSVDYARTITFSSLVVMQWANAFNARSELESLFSRLRVVNIKFYIGFSIAVLVQLLAMFGPLSGILHVVPVEMSHLLITGTISAIAIVTVSEIHKYIGRRIQRDN